MADGIAVGRCSELTLAHAQTYVDEVVTVDEEEISQAMLLLVERAKAVVEPAGAAALAAILAGRVPGRRAGGGGAVGRQRRPPAATKLIEHGLSAAGRYLTLRIVMADRVGALAALTGELARLRPQRPRRGAPPQRPGPGAGRGGGAGDRRDPRPRPTTPRWSAPSPRRATGSSRSAEAIGRRRRGTAPGGSSTSHRHSPWGGAGWPAAARERDRRTAVISPALRLAQAHLDQGADDGAHHLLAERRRLDLEAQHPVAQVHPAGVADHPHQRAPATGGRRQNDEKSCSPYSGSQASRMARQVEGPLHVPGRAGRERVRHRVVAHRVAVAAAGRRAAGVEALGGDLGRPHHDRGAAGPG